MFARFYGELTGINAHDEDPLLRDSVEVLES